MNHLKNINLPLSILLGCIILGGFYFGSVIIKQNSIENQQRMELNAQKEADQKKADSAALENLQQQQKEDAEKNAKAACVEEAKKNAIAQYDNSSFCTGDYPSDKCFMGTYLIANYDTYYNTCLQENGLI